MWKINKKKMIIWLSIGIVSAAIIAPVVATTIIKNDNNNNRSYQFDGQTFNSKNSLFQYAKSAASIETNTIRNRNKWSIESNGETIYFNNVDDLMNLISSKIVQHEATSSINIETGINNEIATSSYADLNLNDKNIKTLDIYRGKNNTFYTTESAAKDSYLQIHDAYYFDGIFFRTKEELSVYLDKNYDTISLKTSNVVIKAPDGIYSQPIDINNIDVNTKTYIEQFVRDYKKEYLQFQTKENNNIVYKYYDRNAIEQNIGNIVTDFTDVSFVNINSNQGKPNFIVDTNKNDEYDFFGPYYTKSSAALLKITDKSLWRKIEGKDQSFIDNQREVQLFSSFVDTFVFDNDSDPNWPYPFNFASLNDQIKEYFNILKNYQNGSVYNSVISLYNQMKQGKRYSSFYKLPILYIHTIEKLIQVEADQNIVQQTKKLYETIASYYDMKIKSIVPSFFLQNIHNSNKIFSFVDLFGFDKSNLDLNVDIESYFDIIIYDYPKLLEVADFISTAVGLTSLTLDVLPFDLDFINKNFKKSFSKNGLYLENYRKIWETLSTIDAQVMETNIVDIAKSNGIDSVPGSILDEYAVSFVMRKQNAALNANRSIGQDIQSLPILPDGNLNLNALLSHRFYEDSFFYKVPLNLVQFFHNLYRINSDTINYKIFGLFKLIVLQNPGYISANQNSLLTNYSNISITQLFEVVKKLYYKDANVWLDTIRKLFGLNLVVAGNDFYYNNELVQQWSSSGLATNFIDKSLSILGNLSDINGFNQMKNVFNALTKTLGSFFKFLPFVQIGWTLLSNLFDQKEFSYVFEYEEAKYIWNGGKENSWLFGLIKDVVSDINDMQILSPMRVTEPHILEGKYYNGVIYSDDAQLKKDQLYDILNKRFVQSDILKSVYSFSTKVPSVRGKPSTLVYEKIGTLEDDSQNDLVDYVYQSINNTNGNNSYLIQNVYSYGNGFSFDKSNAKKINIEKLIDNIRATKVATIPILKENYPITRDDLNDDFSIPKYELPNVSWTAQSGFQTNQTNVEYIIIDPNREKKDLSKNDATNFNMSDSQLNDNIKSSFYQSFDVESKTIIDKDLYKYESFSQYLTNINKFYVYEAKSDFGYSKMFMDSSDAFSWLLSQSNFIVYDSFDTINQYTYQDQTFNSLDQYLTWVLDNTKEI